MALLVQTSIVTAEVLQEAIKEWASILCYIQLSTTSLLSCLLQSSPRPVAIKLRLALKWSRFLEITVFLGFLFKHINTLT